MKFKLPSDIFYPLLYCFYSMLFIECFFKKTNKKNIKLTFKVPSFLSAQGEMFSSRLYSLRVHVNKAMVLHIFFLLFLFFKVKKKKKPPASITSGCFIWVTCMKIVLWNLSLYFVTENYRKKKEM